MNENQRKVLIGIGSLVAVMLIFPPYRIYDRGMNSDSVMETGYAFLFNLPDRAIMDVATLFAQWVGVLIIGTVVFFLMKDK